MILLLASNISAGHMRRQLFFCHQQPWDLHILFPWQSDIWAVTEDSWAIEHWIHRRHTALSHFLSPIWLYDLLSQCLTWCQSWRKINWQRTSSDKVAAW